MRSNALKILLTCYALCCNPSYATTLPKKNHIRINAAFPVYRGFGVADHKDPDLRPFGSVAYGRHFTSIFLELEGLYLSLPSTSIDPDDSTVGTTTRFTSTGALINAGLILVDTDKVVFSLGLGAGLGINKTSDTKDLDQETMYIGAKAFVPLIQIFLGFSYKVTRDVYFDTHLRYIYLNKFISKDFYVPSVIYTLEDPQIVDFGAGIVWKF